MKVFLEEEDGGGGVVCEFATEFALNLTSNICLIDFQSGKKVRKSKENRVTNCSNYGFSLTL